MADSKLQRFPTGSKKRDAFDLAEDSFSPPSEEDDHTPLEEELQDFTPREKIFVIEYRDMRGVERQAKVKSIVPSVDTEIEIGVATARLAGGVPVDNLSTYTRGILAILAYVSKTMEIPKGLRDLAAIDVPTLELLYEVALTHKAEFFRRGPSKGQNVQESRVGILRIDGERVLLSSEPLPDGDA